MPQFKAIAIRWVSDEPLPGLIELVVLDATGREHRIHEKDIVTEEGLTKQAAFQVEVWIDATFQDSSDGNLTVTLPWSMSTTEGETQVTLSPSMIRR